MLTLFVTFLHLQSVFSKKVVVKYFGEDYLVDGGCKAKDETVLKYEHLKSVFSKAKYFRLCLTHELSSERPMRDIR